METQPLPRAMPYSADRLSPVTKRVDFVGACAWAGPISVSPSKMVAMQNFKRYSL